MRLIALSSLTNAVLYQTGWFACVLGAAWGWGSAGAALALALTASHLALVGRPGRELLLVAAAALVGLTVDSLHAGFGVLEFTGHEAGTLAPLWIVALWAQFATVLHFCMRWLSKRYLLASVLGLVGGPMSFLAGERLGAATFGEPRALSLAVLGISWSIALPALVALADRLAQAGRYRIFVRKPRQAGRTELVFARRARVALVVILALAFSAGCAAAPRGEAEVSWMEYLAVQDSIESEGAPFAAGSEKERRSVERFQNALSDFKAPDFGERIGEVYAADAFFNDTLKTLRGVDAIREHLMATAAAIDHGTVEFLDVVGANGNYYFRWAMTIRFKRVARGEDKRSVGMTHVRFNSEGKVLLHQDFWDSTGGLFEHVPMLGWMLRRAKKGL